jgi:hypothetical protein
MTSVGALPVSFNPQDFVVVEKEKKIFVDT